MESSLKPKFPELFNIFIPTKNCYIYRNCLPKTRLRNFRVISEEFLKQLVSKNNKIRLALKYNYLPYKLVVTNSQVVHLLLRID